MSHSPLDQTQNKPKIYGEEEEEEETFAKAMQIAHSSAFSMTVMAAVELGLFEIIATAAPGCSGLSADEIADRLSGCTNTDAPKMLERILRLLVSHNVLSCTVAESRKRLYGLTTVAKYFVPDDDGVSLGPYMLLAQGTAFLHSWTCLKDAVLKGGRPFNLSYGMNAFEYQATHPQVSHLFNTAMLNHTSLILKKFLENYKGFDQVNCLVDVGGGVGVALNMIVSKYPHIKGINYDLPQVIQNAPSYPGVEHVAGNMFEIVPEADAIFMKWILHDWDDEDCIKLLKNCHKALPKTGKVIVVEAIVPETPEASLAAQANACLDMIMMTYMQSGKERTRQEFQDLVVESGFIGIKFICSARNLWIMEFYK